jgi:2-polyprenyl-3-methyl-5-hydroxy-6-metoxy-1,4-benzoquinol methylase
MVPESCDSPTFWEHVYRYAFASRFVKGKRVLDIACGEGYGGAALQQAGAAQVIGVDISEAVCLHAHNKYGIEAKPGTAEKIPLSDSSVDVVVSYETIEHIPSPDRFLDECVRVLVPGGRLIISTPNKMIYSTRRGEQNPYHCSEMKEEEFTAALRSRFHDCQFYTQRPASAAWWSVRALVSEDCLWTRIPGFTRVRKSIQWRIFPEAIKDPTDEQRKSAPRLIVEMARSWRRLLNPYIVRPQRKWNHEKANYIIATAIR